MTRQQRLNRMEKCSIAILDDLMKLMQEGKVPFGSLILRAWDDMNRHLGIMLTVERGERGQHKTAKLKTT